jgi:chromosome segregation ATPase
MSTPTPRTDAEAGTLIDADEVVPAVFARTLERELAVAQNWVEHHSQHADDLIAQNAELRAEAERLKADGAASAFINMSCRASRAETDRNNLRADLDAIKAILTEEKARAERAEAELAVERARLDDLVADINDACITLASAKDDCDNYAMQNTEFKLTAVCDVLLQYIPKSAMKGGA